MRKSENREEVLRNLEHFKDSLDEYMREDDQDYAAEFVEITDPEEIGDDAHCTVCEKAINELEGAFRVGPAWVCSTDCESRIEARPSVSFKYR